MPRLDITGEELKRALELDPYWILVHATKENPVDVRGCAELHESPIASLSPYITFHGDENDETCVAAFIQCPDIGLLQGTYHGYISAASSGATGVDVENFRITKPNQFGNAADFSYCTKMPVAEGDFPGFVNYLRSGVARVGNLRITATKNMAADFSGCKITEARGVFNRTVKWSGCPIDTIGDLQLNIENPTAGILCLLDGTPFAKKNPNLTCKIMTGSSDPAVWKDIAENLFGHKSFKEILEHATIRTTLKGGGPIMIEM